MPVHPATPVRLKDALERMEALVQDFKHDIVYTAPEMQDRRYGILQIGLANVIVNLYEETTDDPDT